MSLWYSLCDALGAEFLSMNFMKNALLAVIVMAPLFGLLSTMIVTGKMSFFSDALGHSGFTGIAIGVLCGAALPIWWAVGLAVAFALLFSFVRSRSSQSADTIIGVFSSTAVALGIFIATMGGGSFTKFNKYLIGDILSVTPGEIGALALVLLAVAEHPDVIANGWDSIHINEAGIEDGGTNIESIYGEQVLGIDAANGVLLLRVKGKGYRGVLAVGKNPAALSVETCSTYGTVGQKIGVTAEEHDGVLAMNASGFLDPGGNGNGGTVAGYAMSNGEEYGSHFTQWAYKRIELREDNRFYIKDASAPTGDGTTDATEFQPAMIIDGVKYTTDVWTDSNPRACIGQSDKYEILMLVIEGRLWLEGINGTSVNTCSDILLQHGCMQAMNLDGGSSAMMWFDGKYVMRSSSPDNRYNGGRPAPNAWVYKAAGTFEE